jgi:hypothetical protein
VEVRRVFEEDGASWEEEGRCLRFGLVKGAFGRGDKG